MTILQRNDKVFVDKNYSRSDRTKIFFLLFFCQNLIHFNSNSLWKLTIIDFFICGISFAL